MARNPEQARPIGQFIAIPQIQDGEGNVVRSARITRKPSKHTVRASLLEVDPSLFSRKTPEPISAEKKLKRLINMSPKEKARLQGKTKKARPVKSFAVLERKHVDEHLSAAPKELPQVESGSESLGRKTEPVVEYPDQDTDTENTPLARPLIGLYSQMDELDPDPLATESLEDVVDRKEGRVQHEKLDWAEYGMTKVDHQS